MEKGREGNIMSSRQRSRESVRNIGRSREVSWGGPKRIGAL